MLTTLKKHLSLLQADVARADSLLRAGYLHSGIASLEAVVFDLHGAVREAEKEMQALGHIARSRCVVNPMDTARV